MFYALNPSMSQSVSIRLLGIVAFALFSAISAQLSIPLAPVPITLQVLVVLLAGLTLGARDGAASQVAYLSGIALGLPIAANGVGTAALIGPTAGYLYAFPLAAGVVGLLAVQDHVALRWMASMIGVVLIYLVGASYLKMYLHLSWVNAWVLGVAPFIVLDMGKALLAAIFGEGLRYWWKSQLPAE